MYPSIQEFLTFILALAPLREGPDFFAGESDSFRCLDLLLNQRVGIERATAAALAIHYHFGRPLPGLDEHERVAKVTQWPYPGMPLRPPGRSLQTLIARSLMRPDAGETTIGELPSSVVGALGSLERYHNRSNPFFDPIRRVTLDAQVIRNLTEATFGQITGLTFPQASLRQQLHAVASLLDMKGRSLQPTRAALRTLSRVGEETADALLVYLFRRPALIIDEYLRRILYRHFLIERPRVSRRVIERALAPYIVSHDDAHRLHARINEVGVLYCFADTPQCASCPLNQFYHRT